MSLLHRLDWTFHRTPGIYGPFQEPTIVSAFSLTVVLKRTTEKWLVTRWPCKKRTQQKRTTTKWLLFGGKLSGCLPTSRQNLMGPCEWTLNLSHSHTPYIGNTASLSFAHHMQGVRKSNKFRGQLQRPTRLCLDYWCPACHVAVDSTDLLLLANIPQYISPKPEITPQAMPPRPPVAIQSRHHLLGS